MVIRGRKQDDSEPEAALQLRSRESTSAQCALKLELTMKTSLVRQKWLDLLSSLVPFAGEPGGPEIDVSVSTTDERRSE
jgi:hypothetical protein